jgi:hypothetical protein
VPAAYSSTNPESLINNPHFKQTIPKMNKLTYLTILSIFLASCESEDPANSSGNSLVAEDAIKANLPADFISQESLGEAISVLEARKRNDVGQLLVIQGFIGGMVEPFTQSRALFVLGDESIKTCDKIPGDQCPTPWDACCEDRKKLIDGSITVRLLDDHGQILPGTLKNVMGIEAGKIIKLECIVDSKSIPHSMVVNAKRLELL